jgi:twinkle protein
LATADKGAAFLDAERARRPSIHSPSAYRVRLHALWREGLPPGDPTGWPSLNKLYTVAPGQLTILTGWPGSGKSEWLDALLINLMHRGWKFAIFSPENQPVELHLAKLLEKVSGRPFGAGPTQRLTREEVDGHIDEIEKSVSFIEAMDEGALSPRDVLDVAAPQIEKFGDCKRGLVIDPWNELEHWRPAGLSETEYISKTLSMVRNWARRNRVHVWIVAHPQKMPRDNGKLPVPSPDMISGSQHWWNKADANITVHRNLGDLSAPDEVDIYVQKVRFKHIGRRGQVQLKYDRVTGRYHEPLKVVDSYAKQYADDD